MFHQNISKNSAKKNLEISKIYKMLSDNSFEIYRKIILDFSEFYETFLMYIFSEFLKIFLKLLILQNFFDSSVIFPKKLPHSFFYTL